MTIDPLSVEALQDWVGRRESAADRVAAAPASALLATLDRDGGPLHDGDPLAPLFHWLYFLSASKMSAVGVDGHPKRGDFLPPVPLPRRMWAGGRVQLVRPFRIGDEARRTSEIIGIRAKEGRGGRLLFVTLRHVCTGPDDEVAIIEEQDLVYRDLAPAGVARKSPVAAQGEAAWSRELVLDPVLLFRYSALTFNGHRIHYDRRYATEVEGYPGLVAQAPLLATLLADLVGRERPEARITHFEFRAVHPSFDATRLRLCGAPGLQGNELRLWAATSEGVTVMHAVARLASTCVPPPAPQSDRAFHGTRMAGDTSSPTGTSARVRSGT